LLWWKLPDFFVRTAFWWRGLGRYQLKAIGMDNLPTNGPVILATNADRLESSLQVVSATDRSTLVLMMEHPERRESAPLMRTLARGTSIVEVGHEGADPWAAARQHALETLAAGNLLAVTLEAGADGDSLQRFLAELHGRTSAPVVPVWCGSLSERNGAAKVRVVFGKPVEEPNVAELRDKIEGLRDWIHEHDTSIAAAH
jgi:hypothetical protein